MDQKHLKVKLDKIFMWIEKIVMVHWISTISSTITTPNIKPNTILLNTYMDKFYIGKINVLSSTTTIIHTHTHILSFRVHHLTTFYLCVCVCVARIANYIKVRSEKLLERKLLYDWVCVPAWFYKILYVSYIFCYLGIYVYICVNDA